MKKSKVKELKEALRRSIDGAEGLSTEHQEELLDLMNRIFPKSAKESKDPAPMIGLNPFKRNPKPFDEVVSDGDHFRTEHPSQTDRLYTLLNEEIENENGTE